MLPLLSYIHVLVFHQSVFTIIYNVYMLVREQRSEGSPPRCLHLPSSSMMVIAIIIADPYIKIGHRGI